MRRHRLGLKSVPTVYGLKFDGSTGYLLVSSPSGTGLTTVSIVIRYITQNWVGNDFDMNYVNQAAVSGRPYLIYGGRPGEDLVFERRGIDNVFHILSSNKTNWVVGEIHHVVCQYRDSDNLWQIYVDGQFDNSQTLVFTPATANITGLYIGGVPPFSLSYVGPMFEVGILSTFLTPAQITDLNNKVIKPTGIAGCVLYHDYTQGNASDLSGNGNNGVLQGDAFFEPQSLFA